MNLKTSEPFWLVKNGLLHSYPSLQKDISCDILIIGGGITGSLIAHQCIKDGYNVALIDRREIGNGSTSATTAMLQYEIDVPLYELQKKIGKEGAIKSYRACFDSIDTLQKITQEVKSKCGFRYKKSLFFAAFKKDVSWLKEEFAARKEAGLPVSWAEAETVEKKFGISNTFGGIVSDQGGSIDAFHLTHDILKFNSKKGLQVFDKTEVAKVQYGKNKMTATTAEGHKVKAKKIIYCNGFESTEIIKEKFVKLLTTYAIVGECDDKLPDVLRTYLAWNTADPYLYFRTTDDGRILIGGEDEDFTNVKKREELLPAKAKKLEKSLHKLLPEINFRSDFAWAGTFGETADGLPYIGEHPDFPGAYFVLGFGGNGITFSAVGMGMVSSFLKGEQHELSEYFRFKR